MDKATYYQLDRMEEKLNQILEMLEDITQEESETQEEPVGEKSDEEIVETPA